jgi:hypothetical protein
MSSDYIAFFADPAELDELLTMDWEVDFEHFAKRKCEGVTRLMFGPSTNAWVNSAVLYYIARKTRVRAYGGQLGDELVERSDFVEWALEPAAIAPLTAKLTALDPRNDGTFETELRKFFDNAGVGMSGAYLSDGLEDYYETFEGFRNALGQANGRALVILVPH